MEEDITQLENKISEFRFMQNTLDENEKECYVDDIQETDVQAIECLLQVYKEDEAIIEEMAISILAIGGDNFIDYGKSNGNFSEDKEKLIKYFRKKVKER